MRKAFLGTFAFFLIIVSLGFFMGLYMASNRLESQIHRYLRQGSEDLEVKFQELDLHVGFKPVVDIKKLQLRSKSAQVDLVEADLVTLRFSWNVFLGHPLEIKSVFADNPKLYFVMGKSSRWNWPDFSKPIAPIKKRKTALFDDKTYHTTFQTNNGTLYFEDLTREPKFNLKVENLVAFLQCSRQVSLCQIQISGTPDLQHKISFDLEANYHLKSKFASFRLQDFSRKMSLEGDLSSLDNSPQFKGHLHLSSIRLEDYLSGQDPRHETLLGSLTARLEGTFEGLHPESIKRSVAMKGAIDVREGSFQNVNFFRAVLQPLEPMPDFQGVLDREFSNADQPLLTGKHTYFEIFQSKVQALQGKFYLDNARMKNEHGVMELNGSVGWIQKDVDFRGQFVYMSGLSQFLGEQAKAGVEALLNEQKRVVIPFMYRGLLPNATVFPDLNYVTARLIQNQEALFQPNSNDDEVALEVGQV